MRKVPFTIAIIISLLAAGCGDGAGGQPTVTPTNEVVIEAATPGTNIARPVQASSELVVGKERFVFGLVDANTGQPIQDEAQVTIQFFKVHDDGTATKVGDAEPIYRSENLPMGVYVVQTVFDQPGKWGALMTIKREGQEPYQVRSNFEVSADSTVPMIGEPAPLSENQTIHSPGVKIEEICSARPPDDMHDMTIAEAVQSGKPTVILFAAPGFCPSFTCGPDLEMVQKLKEKYGDKANFIHIEAPNEIQTHTHEGPVDPDHNQAEGHHGVAKPQVQTAREWGLRSEPWLFLVDGEGKIAGRYEGGLTLDEIEPAFLELIQ